MMQPQSNGLLAVSSLDELRSVISSFGDDVLFRGQVTHRVNKHGGVSMPTSFARHGCVPPRMLKWFHYADSVIRALQGPEGPAPSEALSQAILQHYGWRSFYVDATNNAAVAAWFASHRYSSSPRLDVCEDCFEEGVLLAINGARYDLSGDATGHLYVISKKQLSLCGTGCIDLCKDVSSEQRLRFFAQGACILGPLQDALPSQSVVAHIEAPVSVLCEFAAVAGYDSTSDLFPSPEDDPVLKLLLATPWVMVKSNGGGLRMFTQGLLLPQYQPAYTKHLPPRVGLYSGTWVDDERKAGDEFLLTALFVRVPEEHAYGTPLGTFLFPHVTALLRSRSCVVIEFDGLFRYAECSESSTYDKGVVLNASGDLVCVAALSVDHPGMRATGHGVNLGWHYTMSPDGHWVRTATSEDCPCNARHRHEQHLCAIERLEGQLADGRSIPPGASSVRLTDE
jgi:hypothetical protein